MPGAALPALLVWAEVKAGHTETSTQLLATASKAFFTPGANSILQPTSVHGSRLHMGWTGPTACSGCGHPVGGVSQDGHKATKGLSHA